MTTERLRVGTFVLNAGLRHPAVLAQDLATLDVLSGGRLEIGLGAGWNKPEHDAIGIAFEPVGARIKRLTEAITILKIKLGRRHPLTARVDRNLAVLLVPTGRAEEALRTAEQALSVHEEMLGQSHHWTRDSANVCADSLASLDRRDEAAG